MKNKATIYRIIFKDTRVLLIRFFSFKQPEYRPKTSFTPPIGLKRSEEVKQSGKGFQLTP